VLRDGRIQFATVCVAAAIAYLSIGLVRHDRSLAITGPVIMIGYGAVAIALSRRSEAMSLLSSGPADERQQQVILRSTSFTGLVLVAVLVGGALWTLAVGSALANAFCLLCAVGGAAFAGSTVWFSRRV
jgi:hypothetical protein